MAGDGSARDSLVTSPSRGSSSLGIDEGIAHKYHIGKTALIPNKMSSSDHYGALYTLQSVRTAPKAVVKV